MTNHDEKINKLTEELIQFKFKRYKVYLKRLHEEFLCFEFCDRIGNASGDLEDTLYKDGPCA